MTGGQTTVVSPPQVRAGRALLGWTQQQLAERSALSLNAVKRLENGLGDPRLSTILAVRQALETAGIEFTAADGIKGEGVRFHRADNFRF